MRFMISNRLIGTDTKRETNVSFYFGNLYFRYIFPCRIFFDIRHVINTRRVR